MDKTLTKQEQAAASLILKAISNPKGASPTDTADITLKLAEAYDRLMSGIRHRRIAQITRAPR